MTPDETPRATLAEDERAGSPLGSPDGVHHRADSLARPAAESSLARREDERAVAEVLAAHPRSLWNTCDACHGLTKAPKWEDHVAEHLAPRLAAARAAGVAQERERIVARLRRLSDEASVRELADHNAYARRCAYDRAARIAEGAEQ